MLNSLRARPYTFQRDEGQRLQLCAATVLIKASGSQTGAVFNLFEAIFPPGHATPLHIHYAEDVAVYVVGGTMNRNPPYFTRRKQCKLH
jgi:hypothetical protein